MLVAKRGDNRSSAVKFSALAGGLVGFARRSRLKHSSGRREQRCKGTCEELALQTMGGEKFYVGGRRALHCRSITITKHILASNIVKFQRTPIAT